MAVRTSFFGEQEYKRWGSVSGQLAIDSTVD